MRQVGYSGSQNGGSRSEVGGFEVKSEALGAKLVKYKILKKKILSSKVLTTFGLKVCKLTKVC